MRTECGAGLYAGHSLAQGFRTDTMITGVMFPKIRYGLTKLLKWIRLTDDQGGLGRSVHLTSIEIKQVFEPNVSNRAVLTRCIPSIVSCLKGIRRCLQH